MDKTLTNMEFRNPMTLFSIEHFLAELGEYHSSAGIICSYRKLPSKRLYGSREFDAIAIHTIKVNRTYHTTTFPAYPSGNGSWIIDWGHPITVTGSTDYRSCNDTDEYVNEVLDMTANADDPSESVPYLVEYINR